MSQQDLANRGSVADADPHHLEKLDPPQNGKLDPDPHQSEKVEALEDHFRAL
jgi:hypothetical protein